MKIILKRALFFSLYYTIFCVVVAYSNMFGEFIVYLCPIFFTAMYYLYYMEEFGVLEMIVCIFDKFWDSFLRDCIAV